MIFTPFYLPLIGIALLFTFSYMNMLPLGYKLLVVTIVYLLTIFFPTFLIYLYRRFQGWSLVELGQKRRRVVAYAISMACYVACIWLMFSYHIYHFIIIIVIAALLIQAVSLLINIWWKISTHTAAIGGVAGALMAFAELFRFNALRYPRHGTHHSPSAFFGTGHGRLLRGNLLRLPYDIVFISPPPNPSPREGSWLEINIYETLNKSPLEVDEYNYFI